METLINEFRDWLQNAEITAVEIEENVGPDKDITTITFPVDEGEDYISYDIIASLMEDGPFYFYVEYCDVPDVDELELLRFVNDLNTASPLTFTVEDGALCFGYTIASDYVTDAALLARVFFDVWEAVDAVRDDIHEAFGLLPFESGEGEE